ncbi:MAG: hypothetical protein C0399_07925 [Syntrophus sp. (in: bacteria)]|nr:hypothetical protein [Syntrophus sp. (in: bacteria)]
MQPNDKKELPDRLCVLLGGQVAEVVIREEISTGAQNDLGPFAGSKDYLEETARDIDNKVKTIVEE